MKITRDVIADLWPVYESGEASADTRALVREFLAEHPDLARILAETGETLIPPTPPALAPDADKAALSRTQRLIRRRQWSLGLAIFFTMVPMWSASLDGGTTFLFWRDLPVLAAVSVLVGFAFWGAYALASRRLKVKGF